MIYTCYEMIGDCRANRPEGWRYFAANYVPAIRGLLAHYATDDEGLLERVLASIRRPESGLFSSMEPVPERPFVAELRQQTLAELPETEPEMDLSLETLAEAFASLTMVEKQAAWIEGMQYPAEETGAMLRMAPATVAKIRERAAELLRGKSDSWRRSLLRENGRPLGRSAAAARSPECLPAKTFLDVLDGRMSWASREELERHVTECFHCIDHFCRMAEVIEMLRGLRPLSAVEAAPYERLLGLENTPGKKNWRRSIGT
jgi:hypothetical protein